MRRCDLNHWTEHQLAVDATDFAVADYVRMAEPEYFDLAHKLQQWRDEGIVIFEGAVDVSEIDSLLLDIQFLDRHRSDYDLEVEFRGRRMKLAQLDRSALSDPGVK